MASFTRSGSTPFWILDGAPGWCTVAYTPFDLTNPPGQTVSLADSWQQFPGSYLIAPADTPTTGKPDACASITETPKVSSAIAET